MDMKRVLKKSQHCPLTIISCRWHHYKAWGYSKERDFEQTNPTTTFISPDRSHSSAGDKSRHHLQNKTVMLFQNPIHVPLDSVTEVLPSSSLQGKWAWSFRKGENPLFAFAFIPLMEWTVVALYRPGRDVFISSCFLPAFHVSVSCISFGYLQT